MARFEGLAYAGKRVLVTGGSSGIGRSAAMLLVQSGAHVVIAARNPDRLEAARIDLDKVRREPGQVVGVVPMDVDDETSVAEGVERAVTALGGLDVLVAGQGYAETGYFESTPASAFEAMMRTNYFGHVALTRAVFPHFKRQRAGALCLVSSVLGFFGVVGYSAYAASKHAIAGFAKCVRQEFRQSNITVTVAYVPTTDTPGLERENRTKPADAWALESRGAKFAPEVVAACILRATARGQFEVVPGLNSWGIWVLYRWWPRLVCWVTDRALARFHRQELAAGRDPRRPALPAASSE
ncbi:MAG: SDR family oxidoreductase [Polyangiaceae bacterium]|nr:SDR family oxidoreductase [Polyangiaceae bacterium]